MMGLYKKDVYLCKKMMILMAVTFVLLLAFGILWRSAYDYGNLANNLPEDLEAGKRVSEMMFPIVTAFLLCCQSTCLAGKTIEWDDKNHFNLFAYSVNITADQMAKVKLYEVLTSFTVGCVAAVLYGTIFGVIYGFSNVGYGMLYSVAGCMMVSCFLCITVPLVYKYKSEVRAASVPGTIMLVVFYGGAGVLAITNKMEEFEAFCGKLYEPIKKVGGFRVWFGKHWFPVILVFIVIYAAFLAWVYFATLRQIKRRERVCGVS